MGHGGIIFHHFYLDWINNIKFLIKIELIK